MRYLHIFKQRNIYITCENMQEWDITGIKRLTETSLELVSATNLGLGPYTVSIFYVGVKLESEIHFLTLPEKIETAYTNHTRSF